ncbi:unnamed protein product, partial [Rotaria sp. Silwood1]
MVIYIEACESGSMLEGLLPANINVYGTTASNAEEPSYACYYDQKRGTYLGDVYSVAWMEDSDAEQIDEETLFTQFQVAQKNTNTSHVMQYGDLNLGKHHNVSEFQGEGAQSMKSIRNPFIDRYNDLLKRDAVATVDVRVSTVSRRLASSESEVEKAALEHELVKLLNNEFVLNKLWIMANLCEIGPGNLKWNKNGITIMDNGYGSDPDQLQYAEGPGNLKWNKNGITIMDNGYGSDPDQLQYAE